MNMMKIRAALTVDARRTPVMLLLFSSPIYSEERNTLYHFIIYKIFTRDNWKCNNLNVLLCEGKKNTSIHFIIYKYFNIPVFKRFLSIAVCAVD